MQSVRILLVEDSPDDIELTRIALRDSKITNVLDVVVDGAQALSYLRAESPYESRTRPNLVLLDLNLPKVSGREVLSQIKGDPELRSIPVIVLTTSDDPSDVEFAYNGHANSYIKKPVDFDHFVAAVRLIEQFWLNIVLLPEPRR